MKSCTHQSVVSACRRLLCVVLVVFSAVSAAGTPPPHAAWNRLLQQHVTVIDDGHASQVDYAGMQRDHAQLDAYTQKLSAVTPAQFKGWSHDQREAFLINAYNAFTVQLILTRWPDLDSIKDLGSLFTSPWKKDFFSLLGKHRDLDQIETRLRSKEFADPRVHFALNCASISCPMLQPHAYTGDQLDQQLDDAMNRFLGDRTRNHYNAADGTLQVSKIFDWYADDFEQAPFHSVTGLFAQHARQLSDDPTVVARIQDGKVGIDYLPYNWNLNATSKP